MEDARDGDQELELEDVVSDLHALKNLYGLLHKSKAKASQGIDSGQDNNILDEKSSIILKKLLDSATQHALQCQAKIVSSTLEPRSPLEKHQGKPKEEHEDLHAKMIQIPRGLQECHPKSLSSQDKSYSPPDQANKPDKKPESCSVVVKPKLEPSPRLSDSKRNHLSRQKSDKPTIIFEEKSNSTDRAGLHRSSRFMDTWQKTDSRATTKTQSRAAPDPTAQEEEPRSISAHHEATSQKRSRLEPSEPSGHATTRNRIASHTTHRKRNGQITNLQPKHGPSEQSLIRTIKTVASEKASVKDEMKKTAMARKMERSRSSASRASHCRVTTERSLSYYKDTSLNKPGKPNRDRELSNRVSTPPRQIGSGDRDPVGPPQPRIPSRMRSIRYSSTSRTTGSTESTGRASSCSTRSDTRGSALAPRVRRYPDVRKDRGMPRRMPSRLPVVPVPAARAPAKSPSPELRRKFVERTPRRMLSQSHHGKVGPSPELRRKFVERTPRRMLSQSHNVMVGQSPELRQKFVERTPRRMLSQSHHGKVGPSRRDDRKKPEKTEEGGRLRQLKNKLAIIFHHHHHHHHHLHGGEDVKVHRSPWEYLRGFLRSTRNGEERGKRVAEGTAVRHQHGYLHALLEALLRHVWGTRQRRVAKAEKRPRRLGRAASGRVGSKKLHWWQRFRKRGGVKLAGRSKPRLRLGYTRGQTKNNRNS